MLRCTDAYSDRSRLTCICGEAYAKHEEANQNTSLPNYGEAKDKLLCGCVCLYVPPQRLNYLTDFDV